MEKWTIIDEFPNYLISTEGRVKNRTSGKLLRISSANPYPSVALCRNGEWFRIGLHRLVASAFVDGKRPGLIVNHIDGDKANYRIENLEWITHKQNMEHARRTGLIRKLRSWMYDPETNELVEIERHTRKKKLS